MSDAFSAREGAANRPEAGAGSGSPQPQDRLSQGLELLFGERFAEFRRHIERLEVEGEHRLAGLERQSLAQGMLLDELSDKARGALEREQAEYKRRKAVESQLRERGARHRAVMESVLEESRQRSERFEKQITEQLEAFRGALRSLEDQQQKLGLPEIHRQISRLAAAKLERSELAEQLSALARRVAGD